METSKFDAWIKKILSTEPVEISCSECLILLPGYVDAEIFNRPIEADQLKVKQHLHQCQVCQEEYEILHHLAHMDAGGESPVQEE